MDTYIERFFNITDNCTRRFDCNEIQFENIGTFGDIIINDVFPLKPGRIKILRGQPGEIDITNYKIVFKRDGNVDYNAELAGSYKQQPGISELLIEERVIAGTKDAGSRREKLEEFETKRNGTRTRKYKV